MLNELFKEAGYFGFFLTLFTYYIGYIINKKFKSPIFNPLLISTIIINTTTILPIKSKTARLSSILRIRMLFSQRIRVSATILQAFLLQCADMKVFLARLLRVMSTLLTMHGIRSM